MGFRSNVLLTIVHCRRKEVRGLRSTPVKHRYSKAQLMYVMCVRARVCVGGDPGAA